MSFSPRFHRVPLLLAFLAACGGAPAVAPHAAPNVAAKGGAQTSRLAPSEIDARIRAEWQKRGIVPSAQADDATFIRRAYIDIAGTLPPAERVPTFVSDRSPTNEKRSRLVAEILAKGEYADHFTALWDGVLMGTARAGELDRTAFRVWLHDQFARNVPWNDVVYSLVTASGRQTAGKQRGLAETKAALAADPDVNAAANYALKFRNAPQDFAGSAAKVFLATQIQCAQCHDHKTEKWTQDEFRRFAASFTRVALDKAGKDAKGGKLIDVHDVDRPLAGYANNVDLAPIAKATPTALDGTPITGNVRQGIAKWMISSDTFARATVNRMWGHMLGRGFVNPVDDIRPSNPADLPDLMDRLAAEFKASGFDLKRLIALIAATEVYQLSAAPPAGRAGERPSEIALWSVFRPTPLAPDELVASMIAATGSDAALGRRTGGDIEALKLKLTRLFSFSFDVDEEFDQARYEGTLAQALELMNGSLTTFGSSARPGNAVFELARGDLSDEKSVEALFLRTLSRMPTADELATFSAHLKSRSASDDDDVPRPSKPAPRKIAKGLVDPLRKVAPAAPTGNPRVAALEDIQWALINSSEFALNH